MKKIAKVLFATTAAILISAFLAPMVYKLLPMFKFEKVLNRLLMISIVMVCFFFVRFDKKLFESFGFQKKIFSIRNLIFGFFLSVVVLFVLVLAELKIGALHLSESFEITSRPVIFSILTAVVVGLSEEFLFRGYLYSNLKKTASVFWALVWTNLIYSSAHFLKSGRPMIEGTPTMWDALRVIGASFQAFTQFTDVWPGFLGLFLFGLVLSSAFLRTKTLFLSIGIHSGAVFFLKLTSKWFEFVPTYSSFIYGGKGFYSGVLGWVFICLIGVFSCLISAKNQTYFKAKIS